MEQLMTTIDILAWVAAILATVVLGIRFHAAWQYHSDTSLANLKRAMDNMHGIKRTFPILWPGSIAIVGWAWIGAGYL